MLKLTIRRWYIAMAFRIPGHPLPACVGFGLPRYESEARAAARDLASQLQDCRDCEESP